MHKVIQLISNLLYNKNMPPSMKNQIIQKFQSLKIWNERVARQRTRFFKHLTKKLCSMGSKCLALGASHMCRK
jgi:hypothetical protein